MGKYVTNIKDLVIHSWKNGSEIKTKAENGDALSCFQMGMVHMLGINTPIDFKKAALYFNNTSLSNDSDAKRLLGFISECEGDFSESFKRYAEAADRTNGKETDHTNYIVNVIKERNKLNDYFVKLNLPSNAFSIEISKIFDDYKKGGISKFNACIKTASLCNDELSCSEIAQLLSDKGDYYPAIRWLQKGNVSTTKPLYIFINKKLKEEIDGQILSKSLEIIDVDEASFLSEGHLEPSFLDTKDKYITDVAKCKNTWIDDAGIIVKTTKRIIEEEEAARIKKEKEEEAARLKKQKEEAEARLRKQQEEEAARIRKEKEEAAARLRKQQEEEAKARLIKQQEEETARIRKEKEEVAARLKKQKENEAQFRKLQEEYAIEANDPILKSKINKYRFRSNLLINVVFCGFAPIIFWLIKTVLNLNSIDMVFRVLLVILILSPYLYSYYWLRRTVKRCFD